MLLPAVRTRIPTRRGYPAANARLFPVPAPVGGLNFRDPFNMMPPVDGTVLSNVICRANGVEVRGGWREWALNIVDGTDEEVHTLFPYNSENPADDRLFAGVGGKIYDVTSSTSTPSVAVSPSGASGPWQVIQFQNAAGNFLCAVNNGAGFYTYDPVGGWVKRTLTGGPSAVDNITSIASIKERLWFTFAGSTKAYYLGIGAISGALSDFEFGPLLTHGGYLAGVTSWTRDGGVSIDDFTVAIGSMGDIAIYAGYDPSSASTWELVGKWHIGAVPKGHRFWAQMGADVYILSLQGLVPVSSLVGGKFRQGNLLESITSKIQPALNVAITSTRNVEGWEVRALPQLDILMLKQPVSSTGIWTQWIMNATTGAWSTFDGPPMNTGVNWRERWYFGTQDGRVARGICCKVADTDGMLIDNTPGLPVEASIQGAFIDFGTPGLLKRFSQARVIILSPDTPTVGVQMNTQFKFEGLPGSPSYVPPSGARWDVAFWNQDRWTGSNNTFEAWVGLTGIGYYGALRLVIRAMPETIYTASHVLATPGGMM